MVAVDIEGLGCGKGCGDTIGPDFISERLAAALRLLGPSGPAWPLVARPTEAPTVPLFRFNPEANGSIHAGYTFTRATTATTISESGGVYTLIKGIAVDVPRYTAHPVLGSGYWAEPAATNELQRSEEFENVYWADAGNTVRNADVTTAPDGTSTADQLIDDNSSGIGVVGVSRAITFVTSTIYTFSVFAKADQLDWLRLQVPGLGALDISGFFDLTNGVVGTLGSDTTTGYIEPWGSGWYRCAITFTSDAVDTSGFPRIAVAEADNDNNVDLDGTSSIFAWGAQLEQSKALTSYIPTISSSVTRNEDVLSYTSPSGLDDEGSILVDMTAYGLPGDISNIVSLRTDTTNRHTVQVNAAPPYTGRGVTVVSGSATATLNTVATVIDATRHALVYHYNTDDFEFFANGVSEGEDSSGAVPTGLVSIEIGAWPAVGIEALNGVIHKVSLFGADGILTHGGA